MRSTVAAKPVVGIILEKVYLISFPSAQAGSQEAHKVPELEQSSALSDRLKHLQQLLRATKEAETVSKLHLSALVDMVDI